MWTLQYYGTSTVEKPFSTAGALAGWGFSGECPFEFPASGKSAVHLVTVDGFDNAFQFAYNKKVVIRRDRTYSSGSFSGGTIWFQGFVTQPARLAMGARQNHQYTIYNWMSWAERIGFRQPYNIVTGGTVGSPTYTPQYTDDVVLGETVEEGRQDVAEQITEILTSMNQRHNPTRWLSYAGSVNAALDLVQIGMIGVSGVPMPRNPMRCVKCSEALRECLRQVPDAILWTDYTTTPPTAHVTKLADMAAATLTLPSPDVTSIFSGLFLKPRYDRQLNGFLIAYKMPVIVDGMTNIGFSYDKYPVTADRDDPLVESYIIELAAAKVNTVATTITTKPVTADHADAATRLAWWQAHDDRLNSDRIVTATLAIDLASVTVKDAAGVTVSLVDYPYQLMPQSGAPTSGMGVGVKEATITAKASWHRYLPDIDVISDKEEAQEIHARVTLCDLNTGGVPQTFTSTTIEDFGEAPPTGLAQYLYTAYTGLQHQGEISTIGQDIRGDLALGMSLTIVTPGGSYGGNLIQSISGELTRGVLKAEIGPPGVLGLSDMIEQLRAVRYIPNWKLPSGRSNAMPAGGTRTSLANVSARENTIPGFAAPSLQTTAATFTP